MTDFPAAGYLSVVERNNEEALAAQEAWLAATRQLPGAALLSTLTIVSGQVIPTVGVHRIDTGGAASVELLRVSTANLPDGSLLCLSIVDSSRTVTVRDLAGGAGQINLWADNFQMASAYDRLWLQREGAGWREVDRTYAGGSARWRIFRGLDVAATYPIASAAEAAAGEAANRLITPERAAEMLRNSDLLINDRAEITAPDLDDFALIATSAGLRRVKLRNIAPDVFVSDEYSAGPSSNNSAAHGLGGVPSRVSGVMRCKTANNGYSVGMEVNVDAAYAEGSPRYVSIWCSGTHVGYACYGDGSLPVVMVDRAGGARFYADTTQWRLVLRAWR